jgi:hypothetical protein
MTTESPETLVIDRLDKLPTFCAFTCRRDNPSVVTWIDFWAVEPGGSREADYSRGQRYADEAISHAWTTRQHVFIECVLIFIAIKLRKDNRPAGDLEHGFVDRIVRYFPASIDNVLARSLRRLPRAMN